jgi:hypothetical protein
VIVIKNKGKRFQSEQIVFLGQSLRHRNPGLAQNLFKTQIDEKFTIPSVKFFVLPKNQLNCLFENFI